MRRMVPLFMLFAIFLFGCNNDTTNNEIYKGQSLTIAVIGDIPEVREENINFEAVSLEEISQKTEAISNKFDAVFIMSEVFSEADENRYIATYKDLTIPIFFIETTKAHLPFVTENVIYETAPEISEDLYAAGYQYSELKEGPREDTWRYFLNDDVKTSLKIKDVYSNIFKTIDEQKL